VTSLAREAAACTSAKLSRPASLPETYFTKCRAPSSVWVTSDLNASSNSAS
jgi:hypothetical protein